MAFICAECCGEGGFKNTPTFSRLSVGPCECCGKTRECVDTQNPPVRPHQHTDEPKRESSKFVCNDCLEFYYISNVSRGVTLETCELCRREQRCNLIARIDLLTTRPTPKGPCPKCPTLDSFLSSDCADCGMTLTQYANWLAYEKKRHELNPFLHSETWQPVYVRLEFTAGGNLQWRLRSAMKFCERNHCSAIFEFNGVDVRVPRGACTQEQVEWLTKTSYTIPLEMESLRRTGYRSGDPRLPHGSGGSI